MNRPCLRRRQGTCLFAAIGMTGILNSLPQAAFGAAPQASYYSAPAVVTFNARPPNQFVTSAVQDISGVWEGELLGGNLLISCRICFYKISDSVYTGYDFTRWERNLNNAPIDLKGQPMPSASRSFIAVLKNGQADYQELQKLMPDKFPIANEKLRFVDDNGTPVLINGNNQPNRKFYLKRISTTFPADHLDSIVRENSLTVAASSFKDSANEGTVAYNDHGAVTVSVQNASPIDLSGLQCRVTTDESVNGILDYGRLNRGFTLAKGAKAEVTLPVNTDFGVPTGSLHFNYTVMLRSAVMATGTLEVPTKAFFTAADVSVPSSTTPRMRAVSAYFGFDGANYGDVPSRLDGLAGSGDKVAAMWQAVFTTMGYGGYKLDEEHGRELGLACIRDVEEKARAGDAEALYLLFYGCEMGLEGDTARNFGGGLLNRAASAGYLPALYDQALKQDQAKQYQAAMADLEKVYGLGVRKAAYLLGLMYEKGLGVQKDLDGAIGWYKKGMAFGDPDATLEMATLYSNGFEDTPPDAEKALSLAKEAAAKKCAKAMLYNGKLYFDGRQGIARDVPEAVKWFKAGVDLGDRQSMLALGETYLADGPGMTPNDKLGLFWIKRAAELGSPKAMMILAEIYNKGEIGEKNVIAGRFWYNQAAQSGYAQADATGLLAGAQTFLDFWNYADFRPSYVIVDEYGSFRGDSGDGMLNGLFSGLMGAAMSYYGNQQQLIDGLEYICKKGGYKIYGGTVSSHFVSGLYLKQGQTARIRSYRIISTGMMSGPANADGLGPNWPEYRIIRDIPCSAVIAQVVNGRWQFIGQRGSYTAQVDGPMAFALNAIDFRNYKGYFDLVVEVPES